MLPGDSAGDILRESIARAIGVLIEQVFLVAWSGDGTRRLVDSTDMHVTFDVVFESVTSPQAASAVSEAERAMEQLELMHEEPGILLDSLVVVSEEHNVELPEEVQVDFSAEPAPSVTRIEAVWHAGAWGPCVTSHCSDQQGTMEREVTCVSAADGSTLEVSYCEPLPPISSSDLCLVEPNCQVSASSSVYGGGGDPHKASVGVEVAVVICASVVIVLGVGTFAVCRRTQMNVSSLEDHNKSPSEVKLGIMLKLWASISEEPLKAGEEVPASNSPMRKNPELDDNEFCTHPATPVLPHAAWAPPDDFQVEEMRRSMPGVEHDLRPKKEIDI